MITTNENIKKININIELSNIDYPHLFEVKKEYILDIIYKLLNTGYSLYYPTIDENNISTPEIYKNNTIENSVEKLDGLINKLTGISNNSKKIGIFGENYIHELISKNFIGMTYQNT